MSHSFDLPFKAMRYTAWSTWRQSKDAFRKRYYYGESIPQTAQVVFGHKVAKEMESNPGIPGSETQITTTLRTTGSKTLKVQGHLDSFDKETNTIIEYKTGHLDPKGEDRWSNLAVKRHKQLDFYSLLVKEKFGSVNPWVKLIWLETEFTPEKITFFDGSVLEGRTNRLQLTGREEVFNRRIAEWERKLIKKDLFLTAKEIEYDWRRHKQENLGDYSAVPFSDSEGRTPEKPNV